MAARGQSNKTEVYVDRDTYVGNDGGSVYTDWKHVTVRIENSAAKKERWEISTDNETTFSPSPIPLLRRIAKAGRLVLQIVPYGENPITAVFDISGAGEPISRIAKLCKWTLE